MNLNILIRLRTIEKTERRHVPADSRTRASDGFIAGNLCLSECMITYERNRTLLSRHFKSAYTGKTRRKQHSTFHRVTYRYLRPTLKAGGIMIDQEKTGRFIADLRKEKKLTQKQLADILNVSDKAVSRWETGRGFPDISSFEDIAAALDISTAEILKGERIPTAVSGEEVRLLADDSLTLAKELLHKKTTRNILTGFLVSLILFVLAVVHLYTPIYIEDPGDALKTEVLSDGRVIAIMNQPVSGWEMSSVSFPDSGDQTFLSCYETLFDRLTGRAKSQMILLGNKEELNEVWYYPGTNGDRLLYSAHEKSAYDGVWTLPRLIYNAWLLFGTGSSLISLIVLFLMRRTRHKAMILKLTALPICFTLSLLLVLAGRYGQVYNAQYYLSGILILTILLYLLFLALYDMHKQKKRA